MTEVVKKYVSHLFHLIYPNNCAICSFNLLKNEQSICTICEFQLPYTNYHLLKDNPLEKKLWGRVKIESASSLLLFEKGLEVQHLISLLKYKNREDIGEKLGDVYAKTLLQSSSELNNADVIIPVPIHPKKLKIRGYNQCDKFADTLGEKLNIQVNKKDVIRNINTISQTGKNRINRWENVSQIFSVKNPESLKNKHIILVDDVMTTGATLEALAIEILKVENTKVSILVMASAM